MATQVILASILFVLSYVVIGVVLIEIALWVMRRLDDPAASATGRSRAVECQLASTLSFQADLGRTYPPESCMGNTIEADQFGYPRTSVPVFQFSEHLEKPTPHVRFNVSAAAEDTWMRVKRFDQSDRASTLADTWHTIRVGDITSG